MNLPSLIVDLPPQQARALTRFWILLMVSNGDPVQISPEQLEAVFKDGPSDAPSGRSPALSAWMAFCDGLERDGTLTREALLDEQYTR